PWFHVPYRDFFITVARGRYLRVRGRWTPKSFGYVENTVYELERLMMAPSDRVNGTTLYLADYPPLEVGEWAEDVRRELGAPPIPTVPLVTLRLIARMGEVFEEVSRRPAPLTTFRLTNLLTPMIYDLSELEAIVGELPVSLDEGVRRTVEWLQREAFV